MTRRLNLILSTLICFCGGILAAYVSPKVVGAQGPRQPQRVVSAQKFILVNDHGAQAGIFGFDKNGNPEITLIDPAGNVIWSTQLRGIPMAHEATHGR